MYDVIVVGAGIAGLTSAVYLKRYGLNVLILEKGSPGGVLNTIPVIENYPGFDKIDGPTLSFNTYKKVKELGCDYKKCEVLEIILSKSNDDNLKIVKTNKGEFKSQYVIIASGRIPKKLGIKNEERLIGQGVSYCATCDGALYKNRDVVVVGGGNSSLIEAIYLSNICKSVTILVRSNNLRADTIYKDQLNDNIKILYNTEIKQLIEEDNRVKGIITNDDKKIDTDCVFVFIGNNPSNNFIKNLNITNNDGYIEVNNNMESNIPGVYAVGDIVEKKLYQIVTASSDGAIAAYDIKNKLLNK